MAISDPNAIQVEVRIAARPETIFAFFTDPEKMAQWKGTAAELDPRPGGAYRVNITGKDTASGQCTHVEPNHRIVFTWGWEGEGHPVPPGSSTVEVTLTPDRGETIVRLTHYDLPVGEREQHKAGWEHYMARLATCASGGDPGPDPWAQPHMHPDR